MNRIETIILGCFKLGVSPLQEGQYKDHTWLLRLVNGRSVFLQVHFRGGSFQKSGQSSKGDQAEQARIECIPAMQSFAHNIHSRQMTKGKILLNRRRWETNETVP